MRSLLTLVGLSVAIVGALTLGVLALFSDSASVPGNAFTTDTLNPPTALLSSGTTTTILNWTATSDTYAAGYRVLRSGTSGGPYTQVGEVTPRTTTTFNESPAVGTYYYVLRSYYQNWESVNSSEVSATVSAQTNTGLRNCTANAAVTTGSGDNDGFATTPANACADGGGNAADTNSGTNTTTTCADAGKDRHLYYNYGFSIPAGSTINGIEVRLDAWADGTAGAPFICVELSWDGGTTWTAAKNTGGLTATEATYTLGTSSDTWGRTWALTEFSDANFRVRIVDVASNAQRDFFLDWTAVRVTYTLP